MLSPAQLKRRIDAGQGRIPCDTLLKNVTFLDVFTVQWRTGDIAWIDGVIVGIEPGLRAGREIDASGKFVVPGFIDAHVHVESSMMLPANFQRAVLPRGTTTAICDPHELANVRGINGIKYFLSESEQLRLNLQVMLSSCVPATHLETNGGGTLTASDLVPLKKHTKALGLAEMMNMPGVLSGDEAVLKKLSQFSEHAIDGHCPKLTGKDLSTYASVGISSCHESTELEEGREKLIKGMALWIREGSVAKDLDALIGLLDVSTSTSIGFCTDDRNPLDIVEQGHVDYLVREAIKSGVAAEIAYRSASWSVARHYGLDRHRPFRRGAIAPGYVADLVVLGDRDSVAIEAVYSGGLDLAEFQFPSAKPEPKLLDSVRAKVPELEDLKGPEGQVNVIGVEPGKILTEHLVLRSDAPGVAHLTVLERYGKHLKPANAYVKGFGDAFAGAIGSSVGHDSHNLIVVGSSYQDMQVAFKALIEMQGGFCVVQKTNVLAQLALPFAGLMTDISEAKVVEALKQLRTASRSIGCEMDDPFLQLAFLSLPVIPSLKLTDKGLVDVNRFEIISVAV